MKALKIIGIILLNIAIIGGIVISMQPAQGHIESFEGPELAVGAKMDWDGTKVGKGSQWIDEFVETQKVNNGLGLPHSLSPGIYF